MFKQTKIVLVIILVATQIFLSNIQSANSQFTQNNLFGSIKDKISQLVQHTVQKANDTTSIGVQANGQLIKKTFWRNSNGSNVILNMRGGIVNTSSAIDTVAANHIIMASVSDFNNDGNDDILYRNLNDGSNVIWYLNSGGMYTSHLLIPTVGLDWEVGGTNYLNADNSPDILWRNKVTGQNVIWYMNPDGNYTHTNHLLLPTTSIDWEIVGLSDFNSDSKSDIVWRSRVDGVSFLWYMNQTGNYSSDNSGSMTRTSLDFKTFGTADFDGDGKSDLFLRNSITGQNSIWYMNGNSLIRQETAVTTTPDWYSKFNNSNRNTTILQASSSSNSQSKSLLSTSTSSQISSKSSSSLSTISNSVSSSTSSRSNSSLSQSSAISSTNVGYKLGLIQNQDDSPFRVDLAYGTDGVSSRVQVWDQTGSAFNSLWKYDQATEQIVFENTKQTPLKSSCLTASAAFADLKTLPCNSNDLSQKWYFQNAISYNSVSSVQNRTQLRNRLATLPTNQNCMVAKWDAQGSALYNGKVLMVAQCETLNSNYFTFTQDTNGYYATKFPPVISSSSSAISSTSSEPVIDLAKDFYYVSETEITSDNFPAQIPDSAAYYQNNAKYVGDFFVSQIQTEVLNKFDTACNFTQVSCYGNQLVGTQNATRAIGYFIWGIIKGELNQFADLLNINLNDLFNQIRDLVNNYKAIFAQLLDLIKNPTALIRLAVAKINDFHNSEFFKKFYMLGVFIAGFTGGAVVLKTIEKTFGSTAALVNAGRLVDQTNNIRNSTKKYNLAEEIFVSAEKAGSLEYGTYKWIGLEQDLWLPMQKLSTGKIGVKGGDINWHIKNENFNQVKFDKIVGGINDEVRQQKVRNRRQCLGCGSNFTNISFLNSIIFGIIVNADEPCNIPYIRDNLVPRDSDTYLSGLSKTNFREKGASIYKDTSGDYHHRDTLHTGTNAEIEVYNKQGIHKGTNYPNGSTKGGAVTGRSINVN